jgi:hypothetical protein
MFVGCSDSSLSKQNYSDAFSAVTSAINSLSEDNAQVNALSRNISSEDLVDVESSTKNIVVAYGNFVKFFNNLCNSEKYVLSSNAEDCTMTDTQEDEIYQARMKIVGDEKASKLVATLSVISTHEEEEMQVYLNIEISFDFTEKVLNGFTMDLANDASGSLSAVYFQYENSQLKMLSQTASCYDEYQLQIKSEVESFTSGERATNVKDYTTEYMNAMYN